MNTNNFHYGLILSNMLYGVDIEIEDYEELGLMAWNLIGNKNINLYKYTTCVSKNNTITLPCNAISVEAVTTCYEDSTDYTSANIEQSIEYHKFYKSPFYMSGKLIPYILNGNKLTFNKNYGNINVLYKGIVADEEGLPEISDKEANAIATYIAYTLKYKEGLLTNNTVVINLAQSLENKWKLQCDQARVTNLSLNDMNLILNIRDNWTRHSYGFSYKPF